MAPLEICIVGAGLAGLSVAAALDGGDVEATVLERAPALEPLGAGIILQPNAVRALEALGCLDEVREASAAMTELVQHRDGERLAIPMAEVWQQLRLPTLAVHRHALHEALLRRAARCVTISLSREVTTVAREADGRVAVTTADGARRPYDVVVAADGVQSRIRAALVPDARVRPLGLWWARWLIAGGSDLSREWRTERVGRAIVGTFPLGGDQLQVFATIPGDAMEDGAADATLAALLRDSHVLRRGGEHGMRLVHVGPAREVHPHVWQHGGVAFAGDAAHATSPTLSSGGGLAMEDGFVLGRLVAAGDRPLAAVLDDYERIRRPRLAWMAKVGRIQVSTSLGTPGTASSADLIEQVRAMYRPLDDPGYLTACLSSTTTSATAMR